MSAGVGAAPVAAEPSRRSNFWRRARGWLTSSALGSPIKAFSAVFKLDKSDPHLMPDLSAAVVLETPKGVAR
jgi:hypothetical protein